MNTPRIDAAFNAYIDKSNTVYANAGWRLAAELETELAAMTALVDQMVAALRESRNTHLDTIERCPTIVREAITAYEAHKQKHHE